LRGGRTEPVFAGDVLSFEILLTNPTPEMRYALDLAFVLPRRRRAGGFFRYEPGTSGMPTDVPAHGTRAVRLPLPTRRRGRRRCPRVRIQTRFPFGLWQAWAYVYPALTAVVYPRPEDDAPPLPAAIGGGDEGMGLAVTGEDFAGIRPYQNGDPQKMIAWKLAARSDDLSVKLFESDAGGELLLDFSALPALDDEGRLARLARWILVADAAQMRYGLRLPSLEINPGHGHEHRERCLTALALFPATP
jgi:uncharacterized protein (DUF58 family)